MPIACAAFPPGATALPQPPARKAFRLAALALALSAGAPPWNAQAGRLAGEASPYLLERDADAVAWHAWGREAYEEAQRSGKPIFLLIGSAARPGCPAPGRALLGEPQFLEALAGRLVAVAVDADERPDLADVYAIAQTVLNEEPESGEGELWAFLTPSGWPMAAGRVRDGPAWRQGLLGHALAAAAELAERPGEVSLRAGAALASLRDGQRSAAAARPLGRDAVERNLLGLREAYDAQSGRFGSGVLHGPLRLLIGESAAGQRVAQRLLALSLDALERDERPACGLPLAEAALRLRAFVGGHEALGNARHRVAAERLASDLVARFRDPSGAFRAAPAGDERLFAGANGLAIGALAASGAAFERKSDLAAARAAANTVLERLGPAGALRRVALGGESRGAASLEDLACLSEGLLELYEATREPRWRDESAALVEAALLRFADPHGGFFDTEAAHEPLPARPRNGYDGARPSANGVMAAALVRLGSATGQARFTEAGRRTVESFAGDLQAAPRGLETLCAVAAELLRAQAPREARPAGVYAARAARGPVAAELRLEPAEQRAGGAVQAIVTLAIAPGFSINAHRPKSREFSGLGVSVPTEGVRVGTPAYPAPAAVRRRFLPEPEPAHEGTVSISVPLTLGAMPDGLQVRVRVAYQACDQRECRAPDSLVLEAPLRMLPAGR